MIKKATFTATVDDYSQISITVSGEILFATTAKYLLVSQNGVTFRVFGELTAVKLSVVAKGTTITGTVFYI